MRDPITRFPPAAALAWVATAVGPGARVVSVRRLIGGITSSVHGLTVESRRGQHHHLVLRRWVTTHPGDSPPDLVRREARTLEALSATDLPAPRLVAFDAEGSEAGGAPTLLMTRLPGHVHLSPRDPDSWLRQMASALPRIHGLPIDAPPYESWLDLAKLRAPDWSRRSAAWRRAISLVRGEPPPHEARFIHRDFQHFNLLWSRERLTGIVDWVFASTGPMDVDVGHCRLNLAVLFSPEWAERFRVAYEAEAGRKVDPWWDLAALMVYLPGWGPSIEVQAGRRVPVDRAGMNGRIDDLLAAALRRL
jgi:aminoglycoside phosphotransferase (APT) family kinase protein